MCGWVSVGKGALMMSESSVKARVVIGSYDKNLRECHFFKRVTLESDPFNKKAVL
jgi:hypothetical protein